MSGINLFTLYYILGLVFVSTGISVRKHRG